MPMVRGVHHLRDEDTAYKAGSGATHRPAAAVAVADRRADTDRAADGTAHGAADSAWRHAVVEWVGLRVMPVTSHADKKEDEEEESRQQHLAKAIRLRAAAATLWQPL